MSRRRPDFGQVRVPVRDHVVWRYSRLPAAEVALTVAVPSSNSRHNQNQAASSCCAGRRNSATTNLFQPFAHDLMQSYNGFRLPIT
jgi:hypothetical protein